MTERLRPEPVCFEIVANALPEELLDVAAYALCPMHRRLRADEKLPLQGMVNALAIAALALDRLVREAGPGEGWITFGAAR